MTIARIINKVHGGPVISAMEVDQLDDEWIDLFLGIAVDLPKRQARRKAIDIKFAQFQREYYKRNGYKAQ